MVKQTDLFSDWLTNYINYEHTTNTEGFSLDTMVFLVKRLGMPQNSFKSVHTAGSKGKGSVSTMAARILTESGKPSGLYTSPHISDFRERITGPGGFFTEEIYGQAADYLVSRVNSIVSGLIPGGKAPSWFELVTLFAMLTFKTAGLPWAVFETGLGGRLDATNVLKPEACIITTIELEHTGYLGNTKKEIAGEKAGIIKPGIPVFISKQNQEVKDVFLKKAYQMSSPVFFMDEVLDFLDTVYEGTSLSVKAGFKSIPGGASFKRPLSFNLKMLPEIQAENAVLAAYALKTIIPEIEEKVIEKALSECFIPGRFEIMDLGIPVVLDGAHTENSIHGTLKSFFKLYPGKAHLLFACAADKNVENISKQTDSLFSRIIITKPGCKKESNITEAEKAFKKNCRTTDGSLPEIIPEYGTAILNALEIAKKENAPLLITGSFYLLAEVKKLLSPSRQDPES